jgi:hypothetical protein
MKRVVLYAALLLTISLFLTPVSALACQCPTGQHDENGKCVPDPTPTPTPTPTQTQSQQQTQQQNQQQSQSATGTGVGTGIATVGPVTGGSSSSTSSVKDSGNSTVGPITVNGGGSSSTLKDSGNSSNKNTNTNSVQGGNQQQTVTAAATNNGNGNGNGSNNSNTTYAPTTNTNIAAPKIPVETAYAASIQPTVNCGLGYSGGGQGMLFGASAAFTRVDKTCQQLEVARSFAGHDSDVAYCKVMIKTKWAKEGKVSLEDCLNTRPRPEPAPVVEQPQPQTQLQPIVVNVPAPVVQLVPATTTTPVSTPITTPSRRLIGVCTFASSVRCSQPGKPDEVIPLKPTNYSPVHVTTICKSMLNEAVRELRANPSARISIIGNQNVSELAGVVASARVNNVRTYLLDQGIANSRIEVSLGVSTDRTVELWLSE